MKNKAQIKKSNTDLRKNLLYDINKENLRSLSNEQIHSPGGKQSYDLDEKLSAFVNSDIISLKAESFVDNLLQSGYGNGSYDIEFEK